jgi:hypothetical protein
LFDISTLKGRRRRPKRGGRRPERRRRRMPKKGDGGPKLQGYPNLEEVVLRGWSKTSPSSCYLLLNGFWCMTCCKYVLNLCEPLNLIRIIHKLVYVVNYI